MKLLPPDFYTRADTVRVARDLLGKMLVTRFAGKTTTGMITETEAYLGAADKACHAWGWRRTPRNEMMYERGGVAYIYLCYGIHHLFNVVTHRQGEPHAVLVRAVEPVEGLPLMLRRRRKEKVSLALTCGPGALSQALGLHTRFNGTSLLSESIFIHDAGQKVPQTAIGVTTRIGVESAGADGLLPLRFYLKGSPWVSHKPRSH